MEAIQKLGMEAIQKLGAEVDAQWRARAWDPTFFPSIASRALSAHDLPARLTPDEIIAWVLEQRDLPRQMGVGIDFPFTLFRTERFSIQAFFWVDGSVDIHDHGFWGAFQVLSGSSIHTRYDYAELERPTALLSRGELTIRSIEALATGDVREIIPGSGFVHTLFHLERPSVSLLISTMEDPRFRTPMTYLKPGLGFHRELKEERLSRQLTALELVHATRPADYPTAMARFVGQPDPYYAFQGLLQAFDRVDHEELAMLIEAARPSNATFADVWTVAFDEFRRQGNIIARRRFVHSAEHRFFLALVLNAPRQAVILDFVRARFPTRDPIDTVVGWVKELADVPVEGDAGPTAIGVPLDDVGLLVLRSLMMGRGVGGVLERLKEEFDEAEVDAQRDDILDMIAAFSESLFFRALLPRTD